LRPSATFACPGALRWNGVHARIPVILLLAVVVVACGGPTLTAPASPSPGPSRSPGAAPSLVPATPTPEPTLDQEYVVHAVRAIDELARILGTGDDAERADLAGTWLLAESQWVGENAALAALGGPLGEYAAVVLDAVGAHARGEDFADALELLVDLRAGIAGLAEGPVPTLDVPIPTTLNPGDVLTVTSGGEPWVEIVIGDVEEHERYEGPFGVDIPDRDNVFVQFEVTYRALQDDVDYDPLDWLIFTDGVAGDEPSPVLNGPEPALAPNTLFTGDEATGWVVFEVPESGKVVTSYAGTFANDAPIFEVLLRRR
jgi:hypothetical protein